MPPDTKEISKQIDPLTITRPTTWTESWMASPGPETVVEHLNLFIKGLGMGTADTVSYTHLTLPTTPYV